MKAIHFDLDAGFGLLPLGTGWFPEIAVRVDMAVTVPGRFGCFGRRYGYTVFTPLLS